ALRVLDRMERAGGVVASAVAEPAAGPSPPPLAGSMRGNLALLFSPRLIGTTLMSWLLWVSITASYYAFFTWLPSLVLSSHIGGARPFLFTAVIYCAQIPGYFSGAVMNERIGRRQTIVLYIALGALAALGFALAHSSWLLLAAGVVLSFAMNGTYAGVYAYTPEVFPTRVRATGMGLASAVGRLGAVGSPMMVGLLYPRFGLFGVFAATTAILTCGAVGVLALGVSTKGRPLEEIAALECDGPG
ncbi:MAG: MFS transporter, partial [Caulobacteraceae bacterium]